MAAHSQDGANSAGQTAALMPHLRHQPEKLHNKGVSNLNSELHIKERATFAINPSYKTQMQRRKSALFAEVDTYGTRECKAFRDAIFRRHEPVDIDLGRAYLNICKHAGYVAANLQLLRWHKSLLVTTNRFSATMDNDELCHIADLLAKRCEHIFAGYSSRGDFERATEAVRAEVESQGVKWPVSGKAAEFNEASRNRQASAVLKARCGLWWRKKLRLLCGRKVESVLRQSGAVRKRTSPYVSSWAYSRWKTTQRRNAGTLANMEAISDSGDIVPLSECVKSSVANPEIRRNELMTRISGWEAVAQAMRLQGLFLTLTCPSAYHCQLSSGGGLNTKYNGASPAEAQVYLCKIWARIRSAWQRAGIKAFGFRVCEPHHDGTPHFHFLLFFPPLQAEKAWEIFRFHALAEDGSEKGAKKYRADRKTIDPAKGTASGYIAKYISKNIDGMGLSNNEAAAVDLEGEVKASEGAGRVRAWASLWGIRQFQQIGSISVTVWRELRRRSTPIEEQDQSRAERLRAAADAGDWAEFVKLMGGAFVRRDEQSLRALHVLKDKPGRYGEEVRRIIGLVMRGANREIRTRFKEWQILPCRPKAGSGETAGTSPPPLDLCQ